jgi:hypothetical protein
MATGVFGTNAGHWLMKWHVDKTVQRQKYFFLGSKKV